MCDKIPSALLIDGIETFEIIKSLEKKKVG
jgi:hypothetical protein